MVSVETYEHTRCRPSIAVSSQLSRVGIRVAAANSVCFAFVWHTKMLFNNMTKKSVAFSARAAAGAAALAVVAPAAVPATAPYTGRRSQQLGTLWDKVQGRRADVSLSCYQQQACEAGRRQPRTLTPF
jgi:hypothetical protein